MAKKSLLLVDGDVRSLRVLEVSLRKAGYNLATCGSADQALATLEYATPDLILSDTRLPGMDGFGLVEALRKNPDWAAIPIMFLSSDTSVESKVRGLQLGVEDYLTKPIYTKEILARIHLALNRRERDSFARGRSSLSKTRFTGSLEDMGLVDLLQTIDVSRKSGVLELRSSQGHGTIEFRDGQILDAELGRLHGERAVYRLLLWNEGDFDIEFRPVRTEARITTPTTGLLMEGMRRVDEWGRLLEQVPPLDATLEVVDTELLPRLAEIPDELNPILRSIDGRRTLAEVLDLVEGDDLQTLSSISKLFFEGVVQPRGTRTLRPGPSASEEMALVGVEPDAEGRANPDVFGAAVPQGGSIVPPPGQPTPSEPLMIPTIAAPKVPDPECVEPGTSPATHATAPSAKDPRRTLLGPGFDDATENLLAALDSPQALGAASPPSPAPLASTTPFSASGTATSPPPASSSSSAASTASEPPPGRSNKDREDPMAKKNKKNKGSERPEASKRVETRSVVPTSTQHKVEEAVKAESSAGRPQEARENEREEKRDEAASNVIQFPAQAKRTVTQVAVNDDVVHGQDEAPRDEAPRDEAPRDETQPRLKTEEDKAERKSEPSKSEPSKSEPSRGERARAAVDEEDEPRGREGRERRRKKSPMTESGQMRAIGTGEHAQVTEAFFSAPKTPTDHVHDDFADLQRSLEPMSAQSKQWMWGSLGILLVGSVLIGAYWYYQNVHMPQPVQLGQAGPVEMPRIGPLPSSESATEAAPTEAAPAEPTLAEAVTVVREEVPAEPANTEAPPTEAASSEPSPAAPTEVAAAPTPTPTPTPAGETYESVLAQAVAARGAARQIPLLERAIALNPNGADALARLSYIYVGRGGRANLEQARSYAERATAADPTNSQGWLVLGAARGELGDRVGARAAYQSCIERGQGRYVAECRAMLR
ncbi:MAG: hypothetical protein OHK0013_02340 [Sandaracinaceae bacterium]